MEGGFVLHDININVSSRSNITCHWFQKPTDFGTLMNFRSCAPLQQKKIVILGTVHRVFKATSIWLAFHQAPEKEQNLLDQKSVSRGIVSKNSEPDFKKRWPGQKLSSVVFVLRNRVRNHVVSICKKTNLSNKNCFWYLKQTFSKFTFIVRLKLFHKIFNDKMIMYLHLSEITIKTFLGTILKS